ncbi:DUF6152 family protein [Algoriphagus terrigena]|uniref:DUF6152 family protein n=1 Tax=Algoriphagus terrigena TaxID=344884 RepID=UPI00041D9EA2|nr:DUF6152 family protein [Algoriphagus terrigena]
MAYLRNTSLVLLLILSASFAFFHHGWANYDQTKVLDFETTLDESTFGNPHSMATVKYQDEAWTVYLAPASRMTDRGLTAEMIKKGTKVRLVAYPHKTKTGEMRAERIYVDGKKYELR